MRSTISDATSSTARSLPLVLPPLAVAITLLLSYAAGAQAPNRVPELPEVPFSYANPALPAHFLSAEVLAADNTPNDNPVTDAGATLGRVLFYDTALSANGSTTCASCHIQANSFSDPDVLSTGFAGGLTGRHSMSLANAAYYEPGRFFWDERAATLEDQVLMPIPDPVEMGVSLVELEAKLAALDYYPDLFEAAFGTPDITSERVSLALAQFVRSMISSNSKYDQGVPINFVNFTAQENEGRRLFNQLSCAGCHDTDLHIADSPTNIGLDATTVDAGAGNGRFKVPSLRNVAVSSPYMHDGRFATLGEVIDFYDSGVQAHPGLARRLDNNPAPGVADPIRLNLTQAEKDALVAFLETLTDPTFLADVRFSDPFVDAVDPACLGLAVENDHLNCAAVLAGALPLNTTGTTVGATSEFGEPVTCAGAPAGDTVWWRWTPIASGPVVIDTLGSDFDTQLAVHTGTPAGLVAAGCNDDIDATRTSSMLGFVADAGTTYWIQVQGGVPTASGSVALTVSASSLCDGRAVTVDMTRLGTTLFIAPDTPDVIAGTNAADQIYGNGGADVVCSLGGNDLVWSGTGDDVIRGGEGDDLLLGEIGDDTIDGGPGQNSLHGHAGDDLLIGGPGVDFIWGYSGADRILGGGGDDVLQGMSGANHLEGGDGIDTLIGGAEGDVMLGQEGVDILWGLDGNDWLDGGDGNDVALGGPGIDTLLGGSGVDQLLGDDGDDTLYGGVDLDLLWGGAGIDVLFGGLGDDIVQGDAGDDTLHGEDGNDTMLGGDGADYMLGGAGSDVLWGLGDNDTMAGEAGNDTLMGGTGVDTCTGGTGTDAQADCETFIQ
ncbi:MAG: cytochrome c peroxidase [Actinomycetota bacterium]